MSSEYPSHLHVSFAPNPTSFKRTFEQFGYDSGSPMTSALQASGSGTATHNVPTDSSSSSSGNERNKRARSTSSSSVSNRSADSSRSSEYISARSSASLSEGSSTNDHNLSLDQNRRSPAYPSPSTASTSSTLASPMPVLPSPASEPQDEDMSDSSGFPLDIPRPAPLPEVVSSTTVHDALRSSIERFNEFDSHIAALRRSHSRTPSWHPTASPVLSPRESSNDTTEAFDNWDWTHFGASSGSSHTSGEDHRGQYDAATSIGSGSTHATAPRQADTLSFQASDGLSSHPGYTTSSSNSSSSTRSSNTARPSYRPLLLSARTNAPTRESDEFPSGSLASVPSALQTERNNTALNGPDGRQGVHRGLNSGSSNLSWAALASSRPSPPVASSQDVVGRQSVHRVPSSGSSDLTWAALTPPRSSPPVAPSPDVIARPALLDGVFESPTSDPAAGPQAVRRTTHSDAGWRSMRTSSSTSVSSSGQCSTQMTITLTQRLQFVLALGDPISHFYAADEEGHRGTSSTAQDYNPSPSRSTD
ncbi:hypothetical protein BDR04DRAFT_1048679, partial [Suillus decipiens]